jgi:hypothetical protein
VPIVLCCVTTDGASIQTEPVVRVLQPTLSPAAAAHPSIRSYLLTVRTYNISQYRAGHHSSISSYVGTLFNGASSKSSARRGTRSALLRSHPPASHLPKPASQPVLVLPSLLLGCVIVLSNHQTNHHPTPRRRVASRHVPSSKGDRCICLIDLVRHLPCIPLDDAVELHHQVVTLLPNDLLQCGCDHTHTHTHTYRNEKTELGATLQCRRSAFPVLVLCVGPGVAWLTSQFCP